MDTEEKKTTTNQEHSQAYYIYMPVLLAVCCFIAAIYSIFDSSMDLRIRLSAIFVTTVLGLILTRRAIAAYKDKQSTGKKN